MKGRKKKKPIEGEVQVNYKKYERKNVVETYIPPVFKEVPLVHVGDTIELKENKISSKAGYHYVESPYMVKKGRITGIYTNFVRFICDLTGIPETIPFIDIKTGNVELTVL